MSAFTGKHILITGGSTGIGLHLGHELAKLGADLSIIARNEATLEAAREALAAHGGRVSVFSCDVADAAGLGRCIDEAVEGYGRLDGLVANSGYCHPGYFHEMAVEALGRQIDVNLKGCVYAVRYAVPHLLANRHSREGGNGGGFIALTSSPAGNAAVYGFAAYGTTKAGLNNLAHVLRMEYEDRRIRVHVLLPPDTDTPGYAREVELYPKETRAILSGGRLFSPEQVAQVFMRGILRGRRTITVGFEMHLVLWLVRYAPWVWEAYVRWQKRRARRAKGV